MRCRSAPGRGTVFALARGCSLPRGPHTGRGPRTPAPRRPPCAAVRREGPAPSSTSGARMRTTPCSEGSHGTEGCTEGLQPPHGGTNSPSARSPPREAGSLAPLATAGRLLGGDPGSCASAAAGQTGPVHPAGPRPARDSKKQVVFVVLCFHSCKFSRINEITLVFKISGLSTS